MAAKLLVAVAFFLMALLLMQTMKRNRDGE